MITGCFFFSDERDEIRIDQVCTSVQINYFGNLHVESNIQHYVHVKSIQFLFLYFYLMFSLADINKHCG